MKTRSYKVLLTFVLEILKTESDILPCLCGVMTWLYLTDVITLDEQMKLYGYIHKNRPKRGIHYDPGQVRSLYFWVRGKKDLRIAWIEYRLTKH